MNFAFFNPKCDPNIHDMEIPPIVPEIPELYFEHMKSLYC